jgi:hypothetical protein
MNFLRISLLYQNKRSLAPTHYEPLTWITAFQISPAHQTTGNLIPDVPYPFLLKTVVNHIYKSDTIPYARDAYFYLSFKGLPEIFREQGTVLTKFQTDNLCIPT